MPNVTSSLMTVDGERFITVIVEGIDPLVASSQHPNFEEILEIAYDGWVEDSSELVDLLDVGAYVGRKLSDAAKSRALSQRVRAHNGVVQIDVFGDGEWTDAPKALSDQVIRFLEHGVDDWIPLVRFVERLYENPEPHSTEQLFSWIERHNLTITEDGKILAYKGCQLGRRLSGNYDPDTLYSTTPGPAIVDGKEIVNDYVPNRVGSTVQITRSIVEHNPHNGCGVGLHVGTYEYAKGYAFHGKLLRVIVDPADVVSVPTDCNAQKMRVAEYKVLEINDVKEESPVAYVSEDEALSIDADVSAVRDDRGRFIYGRPGSARDSRGRFVG